MRLFITDGTKYNNKNTINENTYKKKKEKNQDPKRCLLLF
jgi:hypothetical protein